MLKSVRLLATLLKNDSLVISRISNRSIRKRSTYVSSSPWNVEIPHCTLPEHVWENVSNWGDKIAIECGITGKSYTFDEIRLNCKRFASSLLKCGLKKGEIVTILLPNMPEYPICLLGTMEAGLTTSAINPIYCAEEIINQMSDSGSRFIIVHYKALNIALQVKNHFKDLNIVCINDSDGITKELPGSVRPFNDMIKDHDISDLEKKKHKLDIEESIAFLPYSSGTTGLPKGVCLTHKSLTANIVQLNHKEVNPIQETTKSHQDTVLGVLPFFHIYGTQVVMTKSLRMGSKLVTLPKFEPKTFLDVLKNNKDIVLYSAPPIVFFMASSPLVTAEALKNLKFTGTGAAPCGSTDIERVLDKKSHPIVQAYGLTEASPVLTHSVPCSSNKASVGPCLPNTSVKTIDLATQEVLPTGQTGELCFTGPQIMKGYLNKPEATKDTIYQGWLHTGDIGYVDDNGEVYIVDRKKELIKVKGFQVPPAELEAVLRNHPSVVDAGVTALPCPRSGEVPVAFVVTKAGEKPDTEEIKSYVAKKVASYKKLHSVVVVDAIPKTASGKILRRQLRDLVTTELKKDDK